MNNADKSILADFSKAIEMLRGAANDLLVEAETFYALGDNWRGNIRHDAGNNIVIAAHNIEAQFSHLQKALEN